MKTKFLVLTLAAVTLTAILSLVSVYVAPVPATLLLTVRWIAIGALILYGFARRSLTTWILVAMVVGAALGHDWPRVAVNLRVVSLIFLRLIKTIIAPLLFATLVGGIATHSDLRKVGRMGVKAILYFEAVTTLALVIGLAAINLSKAGVGARVPPASPGETLPVENPRRPRPFCMSFRRTWRSPLPRARCSRWWCLASCSASRWPWCARSADVRCSTSVRASPRPCSSSPIWLCSWPRLELAPRSRIRWAVPAWAFCLIWPSCCSRFTWR